MKKQRSKAIPIGIAVVVIGILFILLPKLMNSSKTEEMAYNIFLTHLENGNVTEATINRDSGSMTVTVNGRSCKVSYPYTDDFIETLLKHEVKVSYTSSVPSNAIISLISTLLMTAVLVIVLLKITGAGTSEFDPQTVKTTGISFDDIAGLDEIKKELTTITRMTTSPKYLDSGARIPHGILLQGPPGNGKTMLAKAFANKAGCAFIAVNASDLASKFVNVGSVKINKLFELAEKNAPSVIFIDEIDAIGAKRSDNDSSASREGNAILTTLLNRMDGFKPRSKVLVLAATNRSDILDPALTRPGRFDKQLTIPPPDKAARERLFGKYLAAQALRTDVDLPDLVNQTYGMSSAAIEAIVNDALIKAIDRGSDVITMDDMNAAIFEQITHGKLKEEDTADPHDRITAAYHEAGHAVIAHYAAKRKITSISIRPSTAGTGGHTLLDNGDVSDLPSVKHYVDSIKILYGGREAEILMLGEDRMSVGSSQDVARATQLMTELISLRDGIDYAAYGQHGLKCCMDKVVELSSQMRAQTAALLNEHKDKLLSIAEALLKQETLDGSAVADLME